MDIVETVDAMRLRLRRWRAGGDRIVLVPTMGNLHEGHLRLVERAVRLGERTVVSIFVNPAQFGEGEDFAAYPRTFDEDVQKLREKSVDLLFAPTNKEVYPHKDFTRVTVPELSDLLCGEYRPGHFTGVATVVLKLFNMVQPDVAVFGEKDFQQLTIIRRMVRDLNVPVRIEAVETVREADGLAMSSRNRYLSEHERTIAPNLYRLLCEAAEEVRTGATDFEALERRYDAELRRLGFKPDYFSLRKVSDLKEAQAGDRKLVILVAAWLGKARLIDNKVVRFEESPNRPVAVPEL